jgi:hypothetical protein
MHGQAATTPLNNHPWSSVPVIADALHDTPQPEKPEPTPMHFKRYASNACSR